MDRLRLADDEVHLWWADCRTTPVTLESLLPDEDRHRAERLRVTAARRRFVAARAVTRLLLCRYTGVEPSALNIQTGARGKPRLDVTIEGRQFYFNAAHSGATAAVAVASTAVGVDVEALRPIPNLGRLIARFCSESEYAQLCTLPDHEREASFLAVWTCKEAYLKAIGSGVAMPLRRIEVALHPLRLARINNDPHAAAEWRLLRSTLPEPAVCTVAIRGRNRRLTAREFSWPGLPA